MILSKSAEYAVRAVLCLSEGELGVPMPVDTIAARLDVPRNYLSKILHVLAGTEILDSTRGPKGGFTLTVPADELALSQIVRHFDAVPDETTCFLGRPHCSEVDPCEAHARWAVARSAITDFLDNTRVVDLADGAPIAAADPMT